MDAAAPLGAANTPPPPDVLPGPVAVLFPRLPPGVSGSLLSVPSLLSGTRVSLLAFPGAALALFGPAFGVAPTAAIACGAGLAALGLFLGRSRDN